MAYDKDDKPWPTDDLDAEFDLDEELKEVEEYVGEYD